MSEGTDTFIYSMNGGRDTIQGARAYDRFVLDGIDGFSSFSDIADKLFVDESSTELRLDGDAQKISFVGLAASQVFALDWAFSDRDCKRPMFCHRPRQL